MRQPALGEFALVHKPASMYAASLSNASGAPAKAIVLSGPSGGGKSTLLKKLFQQFPNAFAFSVSLFEFYGLFIFDTTRQPRPGEKHAVDYYFTERSEMEKAIESGEFLEYAKFGGNIYGTSKKAVKDIQNSGRVCILDIELQGVRSVKQSGIQAKYIFIKPPSMKILEERLRGRGTETDESLQKRLKHAEEDELAVQNEPSLFERVIVNDVLDTAYQQFVETIEEELKAVKHD